MSAPPVARPLPVLDQPSLAAAALRTARPRQWIKNLLVFAAPAAGGTVVAVQPAAAGLLAFLSFTLAATGTYFVNDAADVEADRRHPVKRYRPVAAGMIGRRTAAWLGYAAAAAALLLAGTVSWQLAAWVAGYLVLTMAYSAGLKNVPVLDILIVAGGFLVRTAGGAAATNSTPSSWLMLLILLGSLYLVTAKRAGELKRTTQRRVLARYSGPWLQQIMSMTLTGTVLTYAAVAFQYRGTDVSLPLLAASLVPFLAGLMRYSLLVSQGAGEAPEAVLTSDRFLLGAGALWLATAGSALYLI